MWRRAINSLRAFHQAIPKGKDFHEKQSELFKAADVKAKNDAKVKEALEIVQEMLVSLDEEKIRPKDMDEAVALLADIVFGTSVEDKLNNDVMSKSSKADMPADKIRAGFSTDPAERTKQPI